MPATTTTATGAATEHSATVTGTRTIGIVAMALAVLALLLAAAAPAAAATVDEAPVRTIAGPATGLTVGAQGPYGIAALPDGSLAVSDTTANAISIFARTANGDVAPIRKIVGADTMLNGPRGLAVLPDGSIAVAVFPTGQIGGYIAIFDADADGNVAPARMIVGPQTQIVGALDLAVAFDGSLFVADTASASILVFAPGASGDVPPARVIRGGNTQLAFPLGIDLLSDDSIAVANLAGAKVTVYASDADGDVAPAQVLAGPQTEIASPAGLTTTFDGGIAVTDLGTMGSGESVVEFAAGVDGDVPPTKKISGPATGLSAPMAIATLPFGALAVANSTGGSVTVYGAVLQPSGAVFVPVEPYRAYDSRSAGGPLVSGQPRMVPTAAPDGAVAVAYNITATGMTGSGYLSVSPGDAPPANTSTLNYTAAAQSWANAAISGVDDEGQLMVAATGAPTQFIVDVVGYYKMSGPIPLANGSGGVGVESLFIPIIPVRAYDSRDIGAGGPLGVGTPRTVNVTAGGLVPADATAVAYTLTQTGTTNRGLITVGPSGSAMPAVSSINWFQANQTSANSSVVAVKDGKVDVWVQSSSGGNSQFIIDILGYYLPSAEVPWAGAYTPIDPQRAYDSRVDQPTGPINGGEGFTTSMAVAGVPAEAVAVSFNLTATGGTGTGFLTTMPGSASAPPVASTLNWWQPNQTLANASVVDLPLFPPPGLRSQGVTPQGTLGLPVTTFAGGGGTQFIIDVTGYFTFTQLP